MKVSMESVYIT